MSVLCLWPDASERPKLLDMKCPDLSQLSHTSTTQYNVAWKMTARSINTRFEILMSVDIMTVVFWGATLSFLKTGGSSGTDRYSMTLIFRDWQFHTMTDFKHYSFLQFDAVQLLTVWTIMATSSSGPDSARTTTQPTQNNIPQDLNLQQH